jgi:hypothetical protein
MKVVRRAPGGKLGDMGGCRASPPGGGAGEGVQIIFSCFKLTQARDQAARLPAPCSIRVTISLMDWVAGSHVLAPVVLEAGALVSATDMTQM